MPLETKHYKLEAFVWGDIYSSASDRRRFTIIDSQLEFISDMIGSGVIWGWDVTDNGDGTVSLSYGMGIINKRVVESFGGYTIDLSNNTIHYIYMQAKEGETGGTSGNSNIASVVAVDGIAPPAPSGLQQESSVLDYLASLDSYDSDFLNYIKILLDRREEDDDIELVSYKEVAFSWDANTEYDFSHYQITRIDGSDIDILGTTTEVFYADINLSQNSAYTYRIIAVDLSGNESVHSDIEVTTAIDTRIPSPPIFVQVFPSDETIEVIWNHSPTDNVSTYRVVVQPLDNYYVAVGSASSEDIDASSDVDFGSTYVIFDNLTNNTYYDVTVYSIPIAGAAYISDGITKRVFVEYLPGAGEVNFISADFVRSSVENVGIETTVIWRYQQDDPYLSFADKFKITFVENGTRFSKAITIPATPAYETTCPDGDDSEGTCYEYVVKSIPYDVGGETRYESIEEYTPYIIIIQTVDEEDNESNGFMARVGRTIIVDPVPAITNFSIVRKGDNSIFLNWTNPIESFFSYNLITISILDLTTSDEKGTIYIGDVNIGQSETYIIPADQFSINYRYTVTITPYDAMDGVGVDYIYNKQFFKPDSQMLPLPPTGWGLSAGDTEILLRWHPDISIDQELAYYKIYRAEFQIYLRSSDFSNIATVPSTDTSFIDYTVVNGTVYTYFVTSVDMYGNESTNLIDDGYIPAGLISANPTESLSMTAPTGLVANANSNEDDVELSWDATTGSFSGYQILRSNENNYSFEVIDDVPVSQTTYIDENALLKDGEIYYYLVRKYKSEVDVIVVGETKISSNRVLVGMVTTNSGTSNVSIDVSSVVNIANFEDPLIDRTNDALAVHHHTNTRGVDKRIELRSNVHIIDWGTNDYQTYSTDEDIEGATDYVLSILGTLNDDYFMSDGIEDVAKKREALAGESPVLYEINDSGGKIVFNEPLYSLNSSFVAPYSSAPSISLELMGISEVDGYLPEVNVEEVSATQFDSGQFDPRQMPDVNHDGRMSERLLPLRLPMQTLDNFVYSLATTYDDSDRNQMGTAVAFYDIIKISSGRLLAATSNGIWLSNSYGNDWEQVKTFSTAVHRLYKSYAGEYYAVTNYGVYKNNGTSFRIWDEMDGLDYVKVIRDIVEDGNANLYVSTDLGVFRLNGVSIPYIEDTWEKLPIFGARSSEAYALVYDGDYFDSADTGRILVSNELGLLQSTDEGRSWNYISDLESNIKIRSFLIDGNYIFALSDSALYREEIGTNTFIQVASLDVSVSRKMEIFNDNVYVTTDEGVKSSVSNDIYIDTDISFVSDFSFINIKNNVVIATTINAIDDYLFIGAERTLHVFNNSNKIWLQYEQKNTIIPTFYIDSTLQKLGYYYNNGSSSHNVSFDEMVDHESIVEVCNKYDIYFAEYGGWAYNKYSAKFVVYNNHLQFGESRDDIELDTAPFTNVVLPTYTDNNAHESGADIYKIQVEGDLAQITSLTPLEGEALVTLIIKTYRDFELFLSQLYEDARFVVDADGNITPFVLPSILTDLIIKRTITSNMGESEEIEELVYQTINDDRGTSHVVSINVVDGMLVFGISFDIYDELTINIYDVTVKKAGENSHRELEDVFEYAYSGPPSYLSQVQQVNIVKLGLFSERHWPEQQNLFSTPLQMESFIPTDDTWYDTLNSTINYEVQDENVGLSLSLFYPSSVILSADTGNILVGGMGGVLSINKDTLEITEVDFGTITDQMVRKIYEVNDIIYILTDKNIFYSSDSGTSWSEYSRSGLPNQLYSIGSIHNNLIIGASDGLYIKLSDAESIDWELVKSSTAPVTVIYSSNLLFVVVDGSIFITANGFTYTDSGVGSGMDITNIDRYGYVNTYVSTNQGLYSDNGTFNSLTPSLGEVDLGSLLSETVVTTVNDITTNNDDKTVVGISNGTYGVVKNDVLSIKESTSLDSIHKVLIVDDEVWLFGQDVFKVPYLDYPIKLSTGAPM